LGDRRAWQCTQHRCRRDRQHPAAAEPTSWSRPTIAPTIPDTRGFESPYRVPFGPFLFPVSCLAVSLIPAPAALRNFKPGFGNGLPLVARCRRAESRRRRIPEGHPTRTLGTARSRVFGLGAGEAHFRHSKRSRARTGGEEEGRADHAVAGGSGSMAPKAPSRIDHKPSDEAKSSRAPKMPSSPSLPITTKSRRSARSNVTGAAQTARAGAFGSRGVLGRGSRVAAPKGSPGTSGASRS
jgi:hypothetical protein